MKQRITIAIFLMAFLILPLFAERKALEHPLAMPTAASNGFGGHHVAYTDNVFSLLVNPAAMVRTQQRSFFTLSPSLMSPQISLGMLGPVMDQIKGNGDSLQNALLDLTGDHTFVPLGLELREFPLSFAWVANGFGFGLWNRVFVNANVRSSNLSLEADVFADVMLPIGFAFKILNTDNHSLDAGITVKPFARTMFSRAETISGIDFDNFADDFLGDLNIPVIVGGSLDAGLLYRWRTTGLQAGLTFNDIYSRGEVVYNSNPDNPDTDSYYFPFTMNFGLSWHIDLAFLGLTVAGDWHDVANAFNQDDVLNSRDWLLDLSAGLEVSLFKMIYLRAGMNELLPSCGVGFSFGPCKIDLSYYGREFGNYPGHFSVPAAEMSISIRPGAKKRDWIWTRRSIVGLFTGVEKVEEETE